MEVKIENKELLKLYEKGVSRKYRLPKQIIDKFFICVQKIEAAVDIYDFWNDKSLNFEKLINEEKSYSMRLNRQYRLEMEIEWINDTLTIGIVNITDISNHYK